MEQFVATASDAGFESIECAADVIAGRSQQDVAALLDRYRLDLVGVCPSAELLDWHWQWDAGTERRFVEEITRAADLGATYFVLPFMRPRGDRVTVAHGLSRAVPIARAAGVGVAVEPIGHFDVLRRAEQLAPLLREQDPDVVSLLLDSFHFFRAGHTVEDLDHYAGLRVAGIQLSNVNDVADRDAVGYRDRMFPLDGRWPVAAFTRHAIRMFPDAPLIVEVIGETAHSTPAADGARRGYRQLVEIVGSLDTKEHSYD